MIKQTQTFCQQIAGKLFECFHFAGLVLQGLNNLCQIMFHMQRFISIPNFLTVDMQQPKSRNHIRNKVQQIRPLAMLVVILFIISSSKMFWQKGSWVDGLNKMVTTEENLTNM